MLAISRSVRRRLRAKALPSAMATLIALTVAGCAGTSRSSASGTSNGARGGGAAAGPVATPPAAQSPTKDAPRARPAPRPAQVKRSTRPSGPPLRVELWGDSISDQTSHYITFALGASGRVSPRIHAFGGSALCDWLPDMRSELDPANLAGFHPQVVIIQFSGDAFGPCMHDRGGIAYSGQGLLDKYAADAAAAIALFSAAKVPIYFASTPISRTDAAQGYVGNTPLGVMFSKLPVRFPTGRLVRFIDASASVLLRGHYTDTLPCQAGETCTGRWPDGTKTVVVRQADGGHFCPVLETGPAENGHRTCPIDMPGARRFALAVAAPVLRDFQLS